MSKLKLCIFSDIHYIDKKPNWTVNQKLTEYSTILLDKIIDKVNNEIKPDVCICLGDMIQASKSKEDDINNIKYIWNKLKTINVPFFSLIGNHELKMMENSKEVLELMGYERSCFSTDIDKYHLLFLGTEINDKDKLYRTQYLSSDDLKWIKEDLGLNKDKKIFIFSHFGIAEDDMKGNFWCEKDPETALFRNRDELKGLLLKQKNIVAVFSGHQHWTKKLQENGISYYIVGSLIENINSDGIPDGVYFEVEVDDCNLTVKEKHLSI